MLNHCLECISSCNTLIPWSLTVSSVSIYCRWSVTCECTCRISEPLYHYSRQGDHFQSMWNSLTFSCLLHSSTCCALPTSCIRSETKYSSNNGVTTYSNAPKMHHLNYNATKCYTCLISEVNGKQFTRYDFSLTIAGFSDMVTLSRNRQRECMSMTVEWVWLQYTTHCVLHSSASFIVTSNPLKYFTVLFSISKY